MLPDPVPLKLVGSFVALKYIVLGVDGSPATTKCLSCTVQNLAVLDPSIVILSAKNVLLLSAPVPVILKKNGLLLPLLSVIITDPKSSTPSKTANCDCSGAVNADTDLPLNVEKLSPLPDTLALFSCR